ncbi:MAG TPA: hypothetical protein VGE88_06995 [Lysobacter sp.]
MQHASCLVRINGDIGNIAAKAPVTPAEVVLLRAIHGPDAVSNIKLLNSGINDKTSHADEMARLRTHYTAVNEDGKAIIDLTFPGHAPQLPTSFRDIGISLDEPKTAPAPGADTNGDGQLSANELKAELTRMGVPFKGNASKATLEGLYQDALDAAQEPMAGGAGDESNED